MKKLIKILTFTFICAMIFANVISAVTPYSTYTYSINGDVLESPDAYVPDAIVDSEYIGLDEDSLIDALADVEVDDKNNVYLVETTQNRVIVLDRYYKLKYQITEFVNEQMIPDKFNNPQGVFVSSEYIYVCDAGNARIVMFDLDGNYVKTVLAPESNLFDEGDIYTPVAVAVDDYGRMFVVSSTTNQGIIVMGDDGEFFGFIGAQKVTYNAIDLIWNTYFKKNAEGLVKYVPTEYNNICMDGEDFLWATISSLDAEDIENTIKSKDKSGSVTPVKKLNTMGTDVLKRNGFYAPMGDLEFDEEPSRIIGVSTSDNGVYSMLDQQNGHVFTYDDNGNLLFVFGKLGNEKSSFQTPADIRYKGDQILVLDSGLGKIFVFSPSSYGELVLEAVASQYNGEYEEAYGLWSQLASQNTNFKYAFVGLGNAMLEQGEYDAALKYFKYAEDTERYSDTVEIIRKQNVQKYFPAIMVTVIVIAVVILLYHIIRRFVRYYKGS